MFLSLSFLDANLVFHSNLAVQSGIMLRIPWQQELLAILPVCWGVVTRAWRRERLIL